VGVDRQEDGDHIWVVDIDSWELFGWFGIANMMVWNSDLRPSYFAKVIGPFGTFGRRGAFGRRVRYGNGNRRNDVVGAIPVDW